MATTTTRWLDRRALQTGDTSEARADQGEGSTLQIVVTVHTPAEGDSPALLLQHSPADDDLPPLDFRQPCRISLQRTGRIWISVPEYTRYLSWKVDGTLDSAAEVTVDLVVR